MTDFQNGVPIRPSDSGILHPHKDEGHAHSMDLALPAMRVRIRTRFGAEVRAESVIEADPPVSGTLVGVQGWLAFVNVGGTVGRLRSCETVRAASITRHGRLSEIAGHERPSATWEEMGDLTRMELFTGVAGGRLEVRRERDTDGGYTVSVLGRHLYGRVADFERAKAVAVQAARVQLDGALMMLIGQAAP